MTLYIANPIRGISLHPSGCELGGALVLQAASHDEGLEASSDGVKAGIGNAQNIREFVELQKVHGLCVVQSRGRQVC